ncbi:hypothetical protein CR513_43349, partial [Mucuna pruriens]
MIAFEYHRSNLDHILIIETEQSKITILVIYVDEVVVIRNDLEERKVLQEYLSREFEMKDLVSLKYFLRIEVSKSKKEIDMSACKPILSPMEEGLKLQIATNQELDASYIFSSNNDIDEKKHMTNILTSSNQDLKQSGNVRDAELEERIVGLSLRHPPHRRKWVIRPGMDGLSLRRPPQSSNFPLGVQLEWTWGLT